MTLIIAGGRDIEFKYLDAMAGFLSAFDLDPKTIVSGACGRPEDEVNIKEFAKGIDGEGERWAVAHGIPIIRKPAQWTKLGRSAGPARNHEMAKLADALLLVWDGKSSGSSSMKRAMLKLKKPIYEIVLNHV